MYALDAVARSAGGGSMSWNGANGPVGFCPNCGSVSKIIWDSKNDASTCFGCGWKSTPKTNADHIRSMTDEELAKWLADTWDCHECSEHERIGDHPLLKSEPCDQECERHCLEWLKRTYEE